MEFQKKYKSHLSNHLRNRELFERQKVSRGWLKRHVDWIDEGRRKDILEEKERVRMGRAFQSRSRAHV